MPYVETIPSELAQAAMNEMQAFGFAAFVALLALGGISMFLWGCCVVLDAVPGFRMRIVAATVVGKETPGAGTKYVVAVRTPFGSEPLEVPKHVFDVVAVGDEVLAECVSGKCNGRIYLK